jgi:hypothetical protein
MPRDHLYTDDTLERLVAILRRAGGDSSIHASLLERHLSDLVHAVGLRIDDSEQAEVWRTLQENEPPRAELAKLFRRMARAKDPFANRADFDLALPQLHAKARVRWARRIRRGELGRAHPLLGVRWTDLSVSERADVREMARERARYHQSFVKRSPPFKDDQNTLLDGLADIFVHSTGFELHRYDLAHGERARFIQFAHLALRPFFGTTEVTAKALTERWERLKNAHRRKPTRRLRRTP